MAVWKAAARRWRLEASALLCLRILGKISVVGEVVSALVTSLIGDVCDKEGRLSGTDRASALCDCASIDQINMSRSEARRAKI